MPSEIETYLYRGLGVHGVYIATFQESSIELTIAPFEEESNKLFVKFLNSRLVYIDGSYSDSNDDWELPWDIIAFDCRQSGKQWEFILHSDVMEFTFIADWPTVSPKKHA